MDENIDVPFLWLWSCIGSSNCLNLDQAVLRVRCLPWLRSDSWSTKKWPPSCHREPESPKSPKNIEDDVIGCACAVMGLEDDSSVWSYPPAHTTLNHYTMQASKYLIVYVCISMYFLNRVLSLQTRTQN